MSENHWSNRMIEQERNYFAENESQMAGAYLEARLVSHYERKECGACGSPADFHSGVGAYVCLENRHILVNGEWA